MTESLTPDPNAEKPEQGSPQPQEPDASPEAGQPEQAEPQAEAGPGAETAPPPPPAPPPPAGTEVPLPEELRTASATDDQRTLAMYAHLATLATLVVPSVGGVLGPLVVWLVKRDDGGRFLEFHAKQALFLHLAALVISFVSSVLGFVLCFPFLIAVVACYGAMAYSIVAAVQLSSRKDFEYKWVGPWVRRSQMTPPAA